MTDKILVFREGFSRPVGGAEGKPERTIQYVDRKALNISRFLFLCADGGVRRTSRADVRINSHECSAANTQPKRGRRFTPHAKKQQRLSISSTKTQRGM